MHEESRIAQFDPKVCTYWLLPASVVMPLTLVGIPLLVLFVTIGLAFTRRYLGSMECHLTAKARMVKKGGFVRTEKTIPLEKITDMGMVQGPVMCHVGLRTLTVETAGQSGAGALMSLIGIVDASAPHLMSTPGFATIRPARTPAITAPPSPEDNVTWKTP